MTKFSAETKRKNTTTMVGANDPSSSQLLLCNLLGHSWPIDCSIQSLKDIYGRYPNCLSERTGGRCYSTSNYFEKNKLNSSFHSDDERNDTINLSFLQRSEPLLPIQYAILGFSRKGLSVDLIQTMVSYHPEHLDSVTANTGYTLLQLAIISGGRAYQMSTSSSAIGQVQGTEQQSSRLTIIRFLLHLQPKLVSKINPITGETPLHCALTECDSDVIDLLLSTDSSLIRIPKEIPQNGPRNVKSTKEFFLSMSSHGASGSRTIDGMKKKSLSSSSLRSTKEVSFYPLYPLHLVLLDSAFIDTDCIQRMIHLYPTACTYGVTNRILYPIHLATLRRFTTVVQCIIRYLFQLQPPEKQLIQKDSRGNTALHFVQDPATCKVLLNYYPNVVLLPNLDRKQLPIHRACQNCCVLSPNIANYSTSTLDMRTIHTTTLNPIRQQRSWNGGIGFHSSSSTLFSLIQMMHVIDELMTFAPTTIQISDIDGNLPLHVLIEKCGSFYDDSSVAAVEYIDPLIDRLIYEYPKALFKSCHQTGNLPLHIVAAQLSPHSIWSINIVRKLLQLHPESSRKKNRDGYLPFHLAIMNVVNRLPYSPTRIVDDTTGTDSTMELIEEMITSYPQCLYRQDSSGRLPIHILLTEVCHSSWYQNKSSAVFFQCLHLMVQRCHKALKCVDSKGRLPIHLAIEQLNNMVIVGRTHTQIDSGTRDSIHDTDDALLVDDDDFSDSDAGDDSMYTTLKRKQWNDAVCDFLMNEYSEAAAVADSCGRLPLHIMVVGASNDSISHTSVKHLVDMYPTALSMPRIDGNLPLHAAIIHGASANVVTLLALRFPVAITKYNANGYTPMHLACYHRPSISIIQPLLQLSPSCWKTETMVEKQSALFVACTADASLDVVLLLTQYSIDLIIDAVRIQNEWDLSSADLSTQRLSECDCQNRKGKKCDHRRTTCSSKSTSYTNYRNKVYKFVPDIKWIPSNTCNYNSSEVASSICDDSRIINRSLPRLPDLYQPQQSRQGKKELLILDLKHNEDEKKVQKSAFISPYFCQPKYL